MKEKIVVGIDFDNTLVNYDGVFLKTAQQLGLAIDDKVNKKGIRDTIRQLPDGEAKWQQVQAHVYGGAMDEALLIDGVVEFLAGCRGAGVPVYIVSHKTQFAAYDREKIDLRQAALDWMKTQGFFGPARLGFLTSEVFFESTRQDKISRIRALNCTHFIDDLEEIFLEKSFPADCAKILYSSQRSTSDNCHSRERGNPISGDMTVMHSWKEIYDHFFNGK